MASTRSGQKLRSYLLTRKNLYFETNHYIMVVKIIKNFRIMIVFEDIVKNFCRIKSMNCFLILMLIKVEKTRKTNIVYIYILFGIKNII